MRLLSFTLLLILFISHSGEGKILVYMDNYQNDHLKAYGLAYFCLENGYEVEWLLNYRGGSFMMPYSKDIIDKANVMDVSFEIVDSETVFQIYKTIEENNMEVILLEKAPRIGVYIPPSYEPWNDAVTLALTYAEIPYTPLYDKEVLKGELEKYDWLHIHHEDFTGQYGKFYAAFKNASWYRKMVAESIRLAKELGYNSVQEQKREVAKKIRDYVANGGFLFAMCSACDTLDIALASIGLDIVPQEIDGTGITEDCQSKLNFNNTLAFHNFTIELDPLVYEHSNIDISDYRNAKGPLFDAFTLFPFSAKCDPVPTMLTQNHTHLIKGFMGQTTFFNRSTIKDTVTILGEIKGTKKVKYIYGGFNEGSFTFYAGHDPEDYQHAVGDPPTDLSLHKNSPGYRLILNNVLFPAAKKEKRKT